ncbi:hypothetical protein AKO1_005912, partial [Acrasis kona]
MAKITKNIRTAYTFALCGIFFCYIIIISKLPHHIEEAKTSHDLYILDNKYTNVLPVLSMEDTSYDNYPSSKYRVAPNMSKLQNIRAQTLISIITTHSIVADNIFQETIYSVMNQTFQQYEWIIINDGSEQSNAIQPYLLDNRVSYHTISKTGLPAARNH